VKTPKVLWVDPDHLWAWIITINLLRERYGFKITTLDIFLRKVIIHNCKDKDVVIIHSGTLTPHPQLKSILEEIKQVYPSIKVGLETNSVIGSVQHLIDFYIHKLIPVREIAELIKYYI